jgi:hypothetical protein
MQNMVWSQYADNTRPERVVIPETVDDFCKVRVEEIREVWNGSLEKLVWRKWYYLPISFELVEISIGYEFALCYRGGIY